MTSLEDVQRYIQNSKDKGELVTIIELAERNIKRIETGKGIIRVVCIREQWYAKFPAGQPPMKLGKRLSTVEVLKRNRKKPPSPADYEISYEEAARRRLKNPSDLDYQKMYGVFPEEDNLNRSREIKYDRNAYDAALANWESDRDALESLLGEKSQIDNSAGIARLKKLQDSGYVIEAI